MVDAFGLTSLGIDRNAVLEIVGKITNETGNVMRSHLLQFFVVISMKLVDIEQEKEEDPN